MKKILFYAAVGTTTLLAECGSAVAQEYPYMGQVIVFAGDYCPNRYAPANGQILDVRVGNDNTALYSIIGNTYGGKYPYFALPNAEPIPTLTPGATLLVCIAVSGLYPTRP